jgi:DNA invertase Pin-like site-specific DNA recombinase
MYVMRQHYRPRPSLLEIGLEFGKHQTGVLSALSRIEARMHDEAVRGAIEAGRDAVLWSKRAGVTKAKERALEEARARVAELEAGLRTGT